MTQALHWHVSPSDLAGPLTPTPHFLTLQTRITTLGEQYLSLPVLQDRLEDLPQQFHHPQARPWPTLPWQTIHPDQVVGIELDVFVALLQGIIKTEAPIRGYTQASRQYLEPLYPQMARFVGGTVDATGKLLELGLWEKEERRHAPALLKVYQQLTGNKPLITPHQARGHRSSLDLQRNLYCHGLNRVATEYGATCLYLWMMAHTTGPLQAILAELLIDEINHMTKFWGFGVWAFPDTGLVKIGGILGTALVQRWQNHQSQGSLVHTLRRMTQELHWSSWSLLNQASFIYTFDWVMRRLWCWHQGLKPDYLRDLFGPSVVRVN
jgi:hypothetical protein